MHKKIIIPIVVLLLISLLMSCTAVKREEGVTEKNSAPITPPKIDNTGTPVKDPIMEEVNRMTSDEKVGQLIIAGFEGQMANEDVKDLIERYHVGGFILFKKNIKSALQTVNLINSIKETNSVNKIPLFISLDEEGGRISRMPAEFKKIPSSQDIGAKDNEVLSYDVGRALGNMVGQLGFNLDFAPVLDINSNPNNKVIGDRALGSDPDTVKRLGVSTMRGLQSQNVIPVVKHFPGHGDTLEDSHVGLPVINYDLERLQSFEFVPFIHAIQNNADAVMIAHILIKKMDAIYPASMSEKIVTNILRQNMGFNGVVMTDDLTMGAILKNYNIGNAAVKSINAGCDILLVCHGYNKEVSVIETIKEAVQKGIISKERLNESVYRIIKLKVKYGLIDGKKDNVDIGAINSQINKALSTFF
ncbi:MAG TPA: beta-N-acetylhexosaminidase [Pseudobacteroides sp.]|uniref:beta-N-acetylhexosaminidase n=1 Tax=Pseudobacteroides sp. TaxID=1968840 RepID=UPI002F9410FE